MNNLQRLYECNGDFQRFITNHLVVFEHWYKDYLGGASIEDDIEAHNWLIAQCYDSGSDYNDKNLPDPCLRLDYGFGTEYASIELGDGTGYIPVAALISAHMKIATMTNDAETLKLYASKVSDLLKVAYIQAVQFYDAAQKDKVSMRDLERMQQLHNDMLILGIEV